MQIKETVGVSFPGSVGSPPLEDVVVLVDSAGVALGVQRTFSARVGGVRDGGGGLIASRYVEIPLVGSDGEVSGILCHASPRSDTRGAVTAGGRARVRAIADVAQFVVHDINNLFAVIGSGLRLLECQSDAAYRKAIIDKMQEAITRSALLSRQLLDAARSRPKSIDGFVAGSRLAAIAGTLDLALRPDITVRTEIAPDLWDFNADPEELYFALLNLCRNAADAMPDGGTITVAARNIEPSAGAVRGFVEIIVADDGRAIAYGISESLPLLGLAPVAVAGKLVWNRIENETESKCERSVCLLAGVGPSGTSTSTVFSICDCPADDGEGMTEEVLSQAFTPYFTTKLAGSGTGLGLPQVQRFAAGRGGAVRIESERGTGTLVRLFLPRGLAGVRVPPAAGRGAGVCREHLAADGRRERKSPRAVKAGFSNSLGPRRPDCPAVRRALVHSGATKCQD